MSVTYKLYNDPQSFRDLVYPYLLQNEAAHCLGIGVIQSLVQKPQMHIDFHLAAFFDEADVLLGAAWMTSPHPLGVSHVPESCIPMVLAFAASLPRRPSGISAPFSVAQVFKRQWLKDQSCRVEKKFAQCIYKVDQTSLRTPLPEDDGAMRLAVAHDAKLLSRWSWEFVVDCKMAKGKDRGHGKTYARQAIHDKSRYVWEVGGKIVSMAGIQGDTPEGIRISWVYTPPEYRGCGYASQLVAAVCQDQFAKGKKRCFLYTDLENPTSNHIYRQIGFEPVDNPLHFTFAY